MHPVYDQDRILKVLLDDSVYPLMGEDGMPNKEDFVFKTKDEVFFMDDDDRACFIVYPFTSQIFWMHAHILKHHRKDKYEIANMFFDAVRKYTKATKLMASVPELYKNIIAYSKNNDFKKVATIEKCYMKNGDLHDTVLMLKEL